VIIWPPIKFSFNTINYNMTSPAPSPPSFDNLLGTDDRGCDVLSNLIYGFRISILFALILTIFGSIIGVCAGAVQGYYGGKLDLIFQRFIEVWSSLPVLYIIIIVTSILGQSFWLLLVLLLLFEWTALVGLVRAEFLRTRNFDYIKAAKALGVNNAEIMFKHILPNAVVSTLTYLPLILNGSIATLISLDFLNLGLPLHYPSLGRILSQGKTNLQAPWIGITGFVFLSVMLTLLVYIGEAVRDAFNPRKILK
jgi:microcin C transport system permease protein